MDPRIELLTTLLHWHRAELAAAYEAVPRELLSKPPAGGGWSVAQVLEHLALTERSITRVFTGFESQAPSRGEDDAFDADVFAKRLDMPAFLDRTRTIKGSQPPGDMTAEQAWASLAESRTALLEQLHGASGLRLEDSTRPHPAVQQPLDGYQWIAFLGLHESRHAAQIREIVTRLRGE